MMDYMSEFPAPDNDKAIDELCGRVICSKAYLSCIRNKGKFTISHIYIETIVTDCFEKYLKKNNTNRINCSLAGWHSFVSPTIMDEIFIKLEIFKKKKKKFLNVLFCLALLNKSYQETLERSYMPGGRGMIRAKKEFERGILVNYVTSDRDGSLESD